VLMKTVAVRGARDDLQHVRLRPSGIERATGCVEEEDARLIDHATLADAESLASSARIAADTAIGASVRPRIRQLHTLSERETRETPRARDPPPPRGRRTKPAPWPPGRSAERGTRPQARWSCPTSLTSSRPQSA